MSKIIEEIKKILGEDDTIKLVWLFSGNTVYIPKRVFFIKKRNRIIKEKFLNGISIKELASQYNLSQRQIYRILNEKE